MEILVDNEMIGAAHAFDDFGAVRLFSGRELDRAELGAAEVLLVRSVTRVDAALLAGSAIRFVGTATAGTDHVDSDWLAANGIAFRDAAGCNARAVAEHVTCLLFAHAARRGVPVQSLTLGIIGFGHVGRALAALAAALGIAVTVNDPPLGHALGGHVPASLEEALACDVVSLHVPLTSAGSYPTAKLVDVDAVARLRPGSLLVNAARGGVVDEAALVARAAAGDIACAIDCWAGEPCIDPATLAAAVSATPHIAGHTLEARARASELLHAALARFLGRDVACPPLVEPNQQPPLVANDHGVAALLAVTHPLDAHSERLRTLGSLGAAERGRAFDGQRRQFGLRRQFASYSVACAESDADTVAQLSALGFQLSTPRD